MKKVTLYLTGGHILEFGCDDISVYRNNVSGKFHKVEWTNADKTFGFDLTQLIAYEIKSAAYQRKGSGENRRIAIEVD